MPSNSTAAQDAVLLKLAEACPVGLVAANRAGEIVVANVAAEQLLGYGPRELQGQRIDVLVPPKYRERHPGLQKDYWLHPTTRAMGAGRDLAAAHKLGHEVPVEIGLAPFAVEGDTFVLASIVDLTERKRLERELRASNDETQVILDALPSLVFLKDQQNNILRVNRAVAESLGLPRDQIEGRNSRDFYPDDADRFHRDDLAVIASGQPKLGYVETVGDRWVQTDKAPVRGRDGRGDKIIAVATDVTQQRRAIESEKSLRTLLEKTSEIGHIGGWEVDVLGGGDPIWSAEICRIHEAPVGYRPTLDESLSFYTEDTRQRVEQAIRRGLDQHEPWDLEATIRTAKGNTRHVRAVGAPEVRDGRCVRLWGALQDITHERQAREELRRAKFSVDNSTDAVYWVREDGSFFYVNAAACEMLGRTREELLRLSVVDVDPEYPPDVWAAHWRRMKRERFLRLETRHTTAGGKSRWVEMNIHFCDFDGDEFIVGAARDVTAQKLTQQAIAESDERLGWAMRNGNLGLWDWDVATDEVLFNDVAKTQLGYPADADWSSFREWETRLHPDDRDQATARAQRLATHPRETYDSTFRLRTAAGGYRWIRSVGRGVFDDDGALRRCVGVHLDVTETREAQLQLQRSEARYRALYENSPVMHASVSPQDGTVLACNGVLVERLGFASTADILGRSIYELYTPACRPQARQAFDSFVQTGRVENAELTLLTAAGDSVPVILNATAVRNPDGEILHSSSTWVDVTEWKRAEAYREQLGQMVEESTSEVFVFGSDDLRFVYANRGACQNLGYSEAEVLRLTPPDIKPGFSEQQFRDHIAPLHDGRRNALRFETVHKRKDGSTYNVDVRLQLAKYGDAQCFVATVLDTTELKRRTHELEQANEQLEQFAYIASHDLKAPLRAVDHLATWLSDDLAGRLPAASEGHLTQLKQRVARMEKLLEDLLAYSRAGRTRGEVREIDLPELIDGCVQLLNLPEGFRVVTRVEQTTLLGDRSPLETVVRNLVGNAAKHHDLGRGEIHVSATRQDDAPGYLRFEVADDGPGIDPEMRSKAFVMFQTLKPRDEVEGSGMGLALAKKLVEAQGGRVWIEANQPRGTRVCFTWPESPTR
ncbi:MAG: PAS domain S-box protein [Planctomycetota bacterium]